MMNNEIMNNEMMGYCVAEKVCENCGRIIAEDEDYIVDAYDRIICEDCSQEMYRCDCCGDYYYFDDVVILHDADGDIKGMVCTDCAERYCQQCPECGRWYDESYFENRRRCGICTPDVILPYHAHNPNGLQFHGCSEYSFINGFIGAELEITGLENQAAVDILEACGDYEFCHFEHDCSVEGAEIIFQPRTIESWENAKPAVNSMYDILSEYGCSSEDGNGLHVHISRTAFGSTNDEQAETIAKFMRLFSDDNFFRCCQIAGCSLEDASDWASNCNEYTKEQQKRIAKNCAGSRYLAVNVTNSNTVEIRLGRSTMDINKFYGWLHFIVAMVRRAETITAKGADSFNEWMYNAPSDVKAFVTSAGVYFTEPVRPIPAERYKEIVNILARNLMYIEETVTGNSTNRFEILKRVANLTENEARALGIL